MMLLINHYLWIISESTEKQSICQIKIYHDIWSAEKLAAIKQKTGSSIMETFIQESITEIR